MRSQTRNWFEGMTMTRQPPLIWWLLLTPPMFVTKGGHDLMKSNVEIIQEIVEQVFNQKQVDLWDQYTSQDYVSNTAPYVGAGFMNDSSTGKHIVNGIAPDGPAEG